MAFSRPLDIGLVRSDPTLGGQAFPILEDREDRQTQSSTLDHRPNRATQETVVDVLIPAFNAAKTIRSAVESIQRQTVRDIRIVVVDDGSTDDTAAIVTAMARTDPRIHVLTKPNGGVVDTLNFGLRFCRSKILARHDADDLAAPERFAKQLAYLQSHPDCVAVGGAARHIDEDGRPLGHTHLRSPDQADPYWVPSREPYILHPFLMTYLASVQKVGGYRYVLHAEDTDLYWRLRETGRLHNLDDVLGDYRFHTQSVSSASIRNGRIGALTSQLAGISALRRREHHPDLAFSKIAIDEYERAESLREMFEISARQLTPAEASYLEISAAAKLLELTGYRPFDLELEDCRFIRRALGRDLSTLAPDNRAVLRRMRIGAAARMLGAGRITEAMTLVAPRLYPQALIHMAFQSLVPPALRRRVRRAIGHIDVVK